MNAQYCVADHRRSGVPARAARHLPSRRRLALRWMAVAGALVVVQRPARRNPSTHVGVADARREAMTMAAVVAYAYDQIDQVRRELKQSDPKHVRPQ